MAGHGSSTENRPRHLSPHRREVLPSHRDLSPTPLRANREKCQSWDQRPSSEQLGGQEKPKACSHGDKSPGSAITAPFGRRVGSFWWGCPAPENQVPRDPPSPAILCPVCDPPQIRRSSGAGKARATYPEGPQGVVGGVGLLPAAPVHQPLQLDQEELLGSGEVRGEGGASGSAQIQGQPCAGALCRV